MVAVAISFLISVAIAFNNLSKNYDFQIICNFKNHLTTGFS